MCEWSACWLANYLAVLYSSGSRRDLKLKCALECAFGHIMVQCSQLSWCSIHLLWRDRRLSSLIFSTLCFGCFSYGAGNCISNEYKKLVIIGSLPRCRQYWKARRFRRRSVLELSPLSSILHQIWDLSTFSWPSHEHFVNKHYLFTDVYLFVLDVYMRIRF